MKNNSVDNAMAWNGACRNMQQYSKTWKVCRDMRIPKKAMLGHEGKYAEACGQTSKKLNRVCRNMGLEVGKK